MDHFSLTDDNDSSEENTDNAPQKVKRYKRSLYANYEQKFKQLEGSKTKGRWDSLCAITSNNTRANQQNTIDNTLSSYSDSSEEKCDSISKKVKRYKRSLYTDYEKKHKQFESYKTRRRWDSLCASTHSIGNSHNGNFNRHREQNDHENIRNSNPFQAVYSSDGSLQQSEIANSIKDVNINNSFHSDLTDKDNGRCLGWRDGPLKQYQWLHYNETLLRAKNFGSGLISCGLIPGYQTLIGLYSQNCPEWILTEQACYTYSLVVVPLYDTLGPDACAFIINQADMNLIVCEDDKKCNLLLDKAPRCLRKIIVIRDTKSTTIQRAKNRGIEIYRFEYIELLGAQKNYPEMPPKATDLCTICYTSGTTGHPKGVMLTHQNVMAGICAVLLQLGDYKPTSQDTMISFLPLSHMLERCCENGMYMVGGSVGFYSGNIKQLADDMKVLKPTVMPAVPRLLNRLYDKVQSELENSFLKRILFNLGIRAKESELRKSIIRKNSIWDSLVFKKIQKDMGGRLRLMVVGSAPLAGKILTFARCALSCLIVEGYGQTECCAPITLTIQGDHIPEHVGPPVACNCIKLVDVPEMEYYASNFQGEVCVKGTNVFAGYYKNSEKTSEAIDEQGWHHTGDIGMWLTNGTLRIIDRKKQIFKLSQGEYIVPEKIESIYSKSQYIYQVFVHGESLKSCIIAIVVPDVDVVKCWALENNVSGTFSVLCANPQVKKLILEDILNWGKEAGLKSFEQVKDIYLHPDPFSIQNGLLTTALKSKRTQLKAYFKPQLEDLYEHLK